MNFSQPPFEKGRSYTLIKILRDVEVPFFIKRDLGRLLK